MSETETGEDYSTPVLPGSGGSDYERYLRTDELLALQKTPEEWVAPRRAALPDRPPELRAVAEARLERGRGGGAAARRAASSGPRCG